MLYVADFYFIMNMVSKVIITYKELTLNGNSDSKIKEKIKNKELYKIEKGIYSTIKNYSKIEYFTKKYPNTIYTLDTALSIYGFIDNLEPYQVATPHKSRIIKQNDIKQYFITDTLYELGKVKYNYQGVEINIYDLEKLLIEVIKNKQNFVPKTYFEIIKQYQKNIQNININKIYEYLKYYKHNEKIIMELEETVLINPEVHLKGIVLAGGSGTRLYPMTEGVSKQLLPVYNKPMIYYPISVLMLAGIKDILIITTKEDQDSFKRTLKDGTEFGVHFEYVIQPYPNGLAEALVLGEKFIENDPVALILGDNIFYGNGFVKMLKNAAVNASKGKATNFGIEVPDPERFGIMEVEKINENYRIISVEEKPEKPKSNYAITGLYFYPKGVSEKAKTIKPSNRGELEITTLNDMYLKEGNLLGELLGGGFNWFDTGTFDSYFDAISSIKSIEQNRGRIVACLEQIAYDKGWIDKELLKKRSEKLSKNRYGKYLKEILKEEN